MVSGEFEIEEKERWDLGEMGTERDIEESVYSSVR